MPLVKPDLNTLPITSLCGIAAISIFCLSAVIAILNSPAGFSPFDMWLGDYGFQSKNPAGAVYYNTGSMLAGLLLIGFYVGFYQWHAASPLRGLARMAGQLIGTISGAALFVAGYLTPAVMPANMIASQIFFVFTCLAILLLHLAYSSRTCYSESTACMGLAATALIVLLATAGILTSIEPVVAEWCTVVAVAAWAALVSRDAYHVSTGSCKSR